MARILIVDDSTVMRKNLKSIFAGSGHEVVGEAADGKQAVLLYSELKPDLVTMDITMPKMTGVEVVKQIINKDSSAKIIMVSALNQKQMVFEALKNGAKHYIIKPIESSQLLGVVNEVLENNEEDMAYKKEKTLEIKDGFKVENKEGEFIVFFNEHLNRKDYIRLETIVKGLLFISPLNVMFDFTSLEDISLEILLPIIKIGNSIKIGGGNIEYTISSDKLRAKINEVVK
ncbi:response regulator [Clostridium sp.]|uniref:response regulator n=1 Tax=Clostridium sp. TaxID=1506 RepID=UPI001A4A8A5C|nr:response regulator [Clostridium sp.]